MVDGEKYVTSGSACGSAPSASCVAKSLSTSSEPAAVSMYAAVKSARSYVRTRSDEISSSTIVSRTGATQFRMSSLTTLKTTMMVTTIASMVGSSSQKKIFETVLFHMVSGRVCGGVSAFSSASLAAAVPGVRPCARVARAGCP